MTAVKGWRGILSRVETTAEDENVVHLNRPSADALIAAIKSEQAEMRAILKEGAALEERHNECQTRMTNARAALVERMAEVGIKAEGGE